MSTDWKRKSKMLQVQLGGNCNCPDDRLGEVGSVNWKRFLEAADWALSPSMQVKVVDFKKGQNHDVTNTVFGTEGQSVSRFGKAMLPRRLRAIPRSCTSCHCSPVLHLRGGKIFSPLYASFSYP